jgi:hypothetical protein
MLCILRNHCRSLILGSLMLCNRPVMVESSSPLRSSTTESWHLSSPPIAFSRRLTHPPIANRREKGWPPRRWLHCVQSWSIPLRRGAGHARDGTSRQTIHVPLPDEGSFRRAVQRVESFWLVRGVGRSSRGERHGHECSLPKFADISGARLSAGRLVPRPAVRYRVTPKPTTV